MSRKEEDKVKMARDKIMSAACLFVIVVASFVLIGAKVLGIGLPDVVVRIVGGLDLVALPVLAYFQVKGRFK